MFCGGNSSAGGEKPSPTAAAGTQATTRSSAGNGEASVRVDPGKPATVEVGLAANAIVVGTLDDVAGKFVGGLPCVVIPDTGSGQTEVRIDGPPTVSGPDGAFRVEAKAGASIFIVIAPPSPTTRKGLVLEAGKTTDLGSVTVGASGAPEPP